MHAAETRRDPEDEETPSRQRQCRASVGRQGQKTLVSTHKRNMIQRSPVSKEQRRTVMQYQRLQGWAWQMADLFEAWILQGDCLKRSNCQRSHAVCVPQPCCPVCARLLTAGLAISFP